MAKGTPYLFCRYEILDDGDQVTPDEEWDLLQEIKAEVIAYRVRDAKPDDADTFLMRPRKKQISGYTVHTWEVAQSITTRTRTRYTKALDDINDDEVPTDEIRYTKFVAVPLLGVLAVDASVSERKLGALSAIGRFEAIVETLSDDTTASIVFAGTPEDARKALETWTLEEFAFTVRPFNPTPRKLGERMHELLVSDGVGRLQAVARPTPGKDMRDSHQGLISEATGLSDAGYGQYGARGKTSTGLAASLSKPKFTLDKEENKIAQSRNRTLKVYIPKAGDHDLEERSLVKALIELYGPK